MIKIREMTLEDIKQVKAIEDECFVSSWKESDLLYELNENPISQLFVATSDDKIVGFIDFMITFNSATISQVAVTSAFRHQGIAGKLLNKMYECLPSEGDDVVEFITLEVRVSNKPARELYKKHGFEEVATKRAYYQDGEDAIYMVKRMK